jgi:putative spermidine/putrescine transport system permease protein
LAVITGLTVYLLVPTIVVAMASISPSSMLTFPPSGFSLKWYANFLTREEFVSSILISLGLATSVGLFATMLAILVAIAIQRYALAVRRAIVGAALTPLILPTIVFGPALLMLAADLQFTQSMVSTLIVLGGAHLILTLPFAIQICVADYAGLDRAYEEAGAISGASRRSVFLRIVVPLMVPSILASLMFCFLTSFDEPVAALFLSRHDLVTLPVRIFTYLRFRPDPTIAAISTVASVMALAAILVIDRLIGLDRVFGLRR